MKENKLNEFKKTYENNIIDFECIFNFPSFFFLLLFPAIFSKPNI